MRVWKSSLPLIVILFLVSTIGFGQTELEPGFNLFSPEQDVEIGRRSAQEVENQMPILDNARVNQYISRVGNRLSEATPGPEFPYQFKVTNVKEVNAFALPGGFMYINRGLIEAADTEAEMAGVMAHEISHVALRHGTNQVSKAYLAQAGLGVLGALLGGGGGGSTSQIIQTVGGFGLNATFLKFSRDAEKQADLLGAQILARAGYDPMAMASFFEKLREMRGKDPSGLEKFFSSHPAPADRSEHVRAETQLLDVADRGPTGNFSRIQALLSDIPAQGGDQGEQGPSSAPPTRREEPVDVTIADPSSRLEIFRSAAGGFRIRHPANWKPYPGEDDRSVTILPEGGAIRSGEDRHIVYGVILNRFEPTGNGSRGPFGDDSRLERAANQLLQGILQNNSYLKLQRDSAGPTRVDGISGRRADLVGRSPVTGLVERVDLYIVPHDQEFLYALFVTPERDYEKLEWTFETMIDTLTLR